LKPRERIAASKARFADSWGIILCNDHYTI
jgi:hypothetical protein